ncbi:ATP-binding cassette subfamily C member 4 isoform X1 [Cataglyphis hispanica]|uniref:ATP-binding cassette subfamily C member 4 isoform X1 n=2 Tax=Cataglyphis hispanica TaxID=1086592 RepID=UPI00217FB996|nr:ATP-binding cassette subfamily C member 4 isoform X1 [Cataglyphis hispanica]
MDGKVQTEKVKNPRAAANILSALTFSWVLRTFWVGYRRDLEVTDLYTPLKEHTSGILGVKIAKAWEKECEAYKHRLKRNATTGSLKKVSEPSLLRVIIKCFGFKVLLYGILLAVMEILLRLLQPIFLGQLLRYYNTQEVDEFHAYLYAAGIILCSAVNVFIIHPYMMGILHMGMKIRIACCSLIYRKTLKLTRTALGETTIGQAVNLLSNDVNRFDISIIFLHYLWIGPLETIIITFFMYYFLDIGISALIGVASLLMFIPLQAWLGKKSSELRLRTAIRTDERVRLTNEIISGIQAIKMYTWEKPFSALIEKARKKEVNVIRGTSYIRGVTMSFIIFSTRMSLFITVLSYVLFGFKITAEKVFMITAYYNILRTTMTVFFPQGITQVAEAMVSIRRLQKFMMYDEVTSETKTVKENAKEKYKENANENYKENVNENYKENVNKNYKENENENYKKNTNGNYKENMKDLANQKKSDRMPGDQPDYIEHCISIENGSAKWLDYETEDTLQNINIKVCPGELIAIVGQVGAGKSSLINVILKELHLQQGSIQVNGKIAYASQEPWLFAGSVRQNILFGRKMDQIRYDRVTKVCQLKRDFNLLPYGDKTIVGERGISLSGGQRARINLARAIYAEADIYLMDDPLSAVDAHVGKHMFEECIDKYLRGKTRILVTHQLQYLRNVGRIIVLKDGAIQAEGTYDELGSMGVDFGRLLENQTQTDEKSSRPPSAPPSRSNSRTGSITSLSSFMTIDTTKQEPDEVAEMRSTGNVAGKVYRDYFRAGGNWCVIFMVTMLCVLSQLAASGGDFFIAQWVDIEENYMNQTEEGVVEDPNSPLTRIECIYIFTIVTVLTIGVTLIRSFAFFRTCMRASIRLHDHMFRSISRATMRFFNTNTSGRVLNRFSKDMGAVDEILPTALIDCLQIGLSLLGIIIVVAIANVWLLIPTLIVGIIFYYLRIFYLATSRSVKRLEGITRSPVFAHLSATLQGLPTIRAFGAHEILTKEFDRHQDLHSSAWYIFIASSRAFGFWLDIFCVLYILLVTLSFLVMDNYARGSMDGGRVGLAITQSIGLTGMFQWGMRQSAELENQMTSVERILEYSKVESEPPLESTPDKKPKSEWPEEGKIEFKNVNLRYAPLEPPVLKNLNFVIYPREKIGIIGRTGAGKSSLIQALFRLADVEGLIEIDGIDTSEIGLHDLRSKISIIPQEPFLFSGSLRRNLDPFDSYSDDLLWRALEEVELKEMGLQAHVNEGGSNLSVGQRQLVCLARAIVRNNPILVLDEATANVDPRTDELIQTTIRKKFEKCTVLTIAHRLNTVMDSDRILVMDAGSAVEFDHPHVLLQKESSFLKSMVQETGKAMAEALAGVARDSYLNRTTTTL